MKILRIVCTVVAAVFIALVIPLGALVSWAWAALCVIFALLFVGLMFLCKQKQEEEEKRARHDDLSGLNFENPVSPEQNGEEKNDKKKGE